MKRLKHTPVNLFSITLGLGGVSLAEMHAGQTVLSDITGYLSLGIFFVLLLGYLFKIAANTNAAIAEFSIRQRIPYFTTLSLSALVLAAKFQTVAPLASNVTFWIAASMQAILTIGILTRWIQSNSHSLTDALPTWFVPTTGNALVAVTAGSRDQQWAGWIFLAVGLFLWLPFFAIVLLRLVGEKALAKSDMPSLAILVNPPALAFLGWVNLHQGKIDDLARLLASFVAFIGVVVLVQFAFRRPEKFTLTLWALVFPFASAASTLLKLASADALPALSVAGNVLTQGLALLCVYLLFGTARMFFRGQLFKPDI